MYKTLISIIFLFLLSSMSGATETVTPGTESITGTTTEATTGTITEVPIILKVGTHIIGTQTYIVQKEKWAMPFTTKILILGQQCEVITLYVPAVDKFESIIYLKDRELVLFFEKAEEWISAISLKFQRAIEKELMSTVNFGMMVNEIDKLAKPIK